MAERVAQDSNAKPAGAGIFAARLDVLLRTHAEQFRELDLRAAERHSQAMPAGAAGFRRDTQPLSRRSRQLSLPIRTALRR